MEDKKTYLFYDIESSGLNKCFDQVLQFAAIRTDDQLIEINRHEIFVKLNPDIIPSPKALFVNQLSLAKLKQGKKEYEAIREIHQLFNAPKTVSVGYNNLGFDDEFLRFSFYRNLFDPYSHQYANGCKRMDIFPMVVIYYLFSRNSLIWPPLVDSKISLKLEQLGISNNLAEKDFHNAIVDVETTLGLARLLRKDYQIWQYLEGCFDKNLDQQRIQKLSLNKSGLELLIDPKLGFAKSYQAVTLNLGHHNYYQNQTLRLPLDDFDLSKVEFKNIGETTHVFRKRFGEPPIILPSSGHYGKYLTKERQELVANNLSWIENHQELFKEIVAYHRNYQYPLVSNLDPDAALYSQGFLSDAEKLWSKKFSASAPAEKPSLLKEAGFRLQELAIRTLGRNYPEFLQQHPVWLERFQSYLDQVKVTKAGVDYRNCSRLSKAEALLELDELLQSQSLTADQLKILADELKQYIQSW